MLVPSLSHQPHHYPNAASPSHASLSVLHVPLLHGPRPSFDIFFCSAFIDYIERRFEAIIRASTLPTQNKTTFILLLCDYLPQLIGSCKNSFSHWPIIWEHQFCSISLFLCFFIFPFVFRYIFFLFFKIISHYCFFPHHFSSFARVFTFLY